MKRIITSLILILITLGRGISQEWFRVPDADNETITAIRSTRDGNLMFSSLGGLFSFNGTYTTVFLQYEIITDFFCESCGDIWFLGINSLGKISPSGLVQRKSITGGISSHLLDLSPSDLFLLQDDGLFIIDKQTGDTIHEYPGPYSHKSFTCLSADSTRIFVGIGNTIQIFTRELALENMVTFDKKRTITGIAPSGKGEILIGTNLGLLKMDESSCLSDRMKGDLDGNILFLAGDNATNTVYAGVGQKGIFTISTDGVRRVCPSETLDVETCRFHIDDSGNMWLSRENNGLSYRKSDKEKTVLPDLEEYLSHRWTTAIYETEGNKILVLTTGQLLSFDKNGGPPERILPQGIQESYIDNILLTGDGKLWVAAEDRVLLYDYLEGASRLESEMAIQGNVNTITEGLDGSIYISTDKKVYVWDKTKGFRILSRGIVPYSVNHKSGIASMTNDGVVYYSTKDTPEWRQIEGIEDSIHINSALTDDLGRIWLLTDSEVIFRFDVSVGTLHKYLIEGWTNKTKTANEWWAVLSQGEEAEYQRRISSERIFSVLSDNEGNAWFGTYNGLIKIGNDGSQECFNAGRKFDYYRICLSDSDGLLYFSYSSGITIFDPVTERGLIKTSDIPFMIQAILVNNSPLGKIDSKGVFHSTTVAHKLPQKLSYRDNSLSFKLEHINFDNIQARYYYTLEGYDQDWAITTNNLISYNNLPPGTYNFKVRLSGMRDSQVKSFPFTIERAPWNTIFAKIIYVLFVISIVLASILFYKRKQEAYCLQQTIKTKEEMSKMKIDFFTNISHEIRTPLTLVAAPLKDIRRNEILSESASRKLDIVDKSVRQLLILTNQLIEYNNIDTDISNLTLKVSDILPVVKDLVEVFSYNAEDVDVHIGISGLTSVVWKYDEVKVGRILSNLLSNAVKYSPDGGDIDINISIIGWEKAKTIYGPDIPEQEYLEIKVSDEGMGIPPEKIKEIFERFERVTQAEGQRNISGYGIGLHYAKQLVTAHQGYILAQANTPKGSIFRFILPKEIRKKQNRQEVEPIAINMEKDAAFPQGLLQNNENLLILIVEDEKDMREYLSELFSTYYRTLTAVDGFEALTLLRDNYVDLVISDVMMPRMNGYELCKAIKEDSQSGYTPVILLTAMTDLKSNIRGLNTGADAYVGKPFDQDYLLAVVNSAIVNRRKKQNAISRMTSTTLGEAKSEDIYNPGDKAFLERLYKIFDEHLSESDFNINFIVNELGMSRTYFYMKIKNMTGKPPIQFFNDYKMNRSKEFLRSGRYSIKEIAYMVGYEASRSFSRSFKRTFGYNPTEFIQPGGENPETTYN